MNIDVLLFDLGGVLIELTGVPTMMKWSDLPEDELWARWLHSEAVRKFESGRSSPQEFAQTIVTEFQLGVAEDEFMQAFIAWPRGPYDGALELLDELGDRYRLGCLSNTNHIHWQRFEEETELLARFDVHLPSHHTGLMKPDLPVYEHAIKALDVPAASILFMDDNQINVDAARQAGMEAELTRTPQGVRDVLTSRALLNR